VRVFRATLRKLVRRPATWVTFGLLVALLGLILMAAAATSLNGTGRSATQARLLLTFPGAYTLILSFLHGLGGLFGVIYGASVAGSEWSWGTLKAAVARGESRSRYQLATFTAIALFIGFGLVAALAIGIGVAIVGATIANVSTSGLNDTETLKQMPELMAKSWLAITEEGALGFAIATLARSQLAGIGAGIGSYFGEQFASIFLADIVKYFPFNAANAIVQTRDQGFEGRASLDPDTALVVVIAWLVGALAVAVIFTERAEISG
jgi:ABC-type transport system involved in multi-copper enzyme maturation permease subunit